MASLNGLHPNLMRPRVEALLADPEARKRGLHPVSAFRSIARQRVLYANAVKKYGKANAGKWVAPPGRSNHGPKVEGYGIAVDFGVRGVRSLKGQWPEEVNRWLNRLAAKYGLHQRMPWEDWHYEPIPNWKGSLPKQEDDLDKNQNKMLETIHHHVKAKDGYLPRLIASNTRIEAALREQTKVLKQIAAKK